MAERLTRVPCVRCGVQISDRPNLTQCRKYGSPRFNI